MKHFPPKFLPFRAIPEKMSQGPLIWFNLATDAWNRQENMIKFGLSEMNVVHDLETAWPVQTEVYH